VGVITERLTDRAGHFTLEADAATELVVNAEGFATRTVAVGASLEVTVEIAAQTDSVRVTGSAIDTPASRQGGGTSVVSTEEIRGRNEAQAVDLLRYLPGVVIQQGGQRGELTAVSIRGWCCSMARP
jgi:outer membrane cobalamin receptor